MRPAAVHGGATARDRPASLRARPSRRRATLVGDLPRGLDGLHAAAARQGARRTGRGRGRRARPRSPGCAARRRPGRRGRRGREPLVGRERELELAADALRDARAGGLRVVGLSRASRASARRDWRPRSRPRRATSGALAVWGRGIEEAGAFAPWGAVLRDLRAARRDLAAGALEDVRRLTGEAGSGVEPVSGEEDRLRMFDAVAAIADARRGAGGLVVVLDDLHWADRSSLELLRHVSRAAAPARMLLRARLPRVRGGAGDISCPPCWRTSAARADSSASASAVSASMTVPALRAAAGAGLRDALVRDLHERTGGNPFFVARARAARPPSGPARAPPRRPCPTACARSSLQRLRAARPPRAAARSTRPPCSAGRSRWRRSPGSPAVSREEARAALEPRARPAR